jgi:hypothetical protein
VDALLSKAAGVLEVSPVNLEAAAQRSSEQIASARHFFKDRLGLGDQLDIVVCGSMARQEMSGASDFDYLIVAHGLVEDASKTRAFRKACDEWCDQHSIPRPGNTGVFGKIIAGGELVEQIGLEFDTNHSLTRRILLLEEGVSVLDEKLHRRFVKVVLSRYLDDRSLDENDVPRFLLNDVCRFWRTIAVDYQAKRWASLDSNGWGLRYLKLRISRKLTFAGSLIPLLLIATRRPVDVHDFLLHQYVEMPPLARLAQLIEDTEDNEVLCHLREILAIADRFAGFLSDTQARAEIAGLESHEAAQSNMLFAEMRELSSQLQGHLEGLFLDSETLGSLGRKYLTF